MEKREVKMETHLKSQLKRLYVKQKFQNLLQRGKYSNKKKVKEKKTEYILKLRFWRNWKVKKEEKALKVKKEKKVSFLIIKCFK